ncbi:hypothetical protein LCGC14_2756170 [marine sediment metagenome]|uniref:Glycosyltransferase 2-like domain-containing protein n=1 Tax=marine sediment metagenome TaxID=412755 RepID=A0A0F8ZMB3_9ZZZZ
MPQITASIATLPRRISQLKQTLASISPQVDRINIYFDGHAESAINELVPYVDTHFMRAAHDTQRRGDAGKFYWAHQIKGYHFTCDDDLVYPPDYVETMIAAIERHERRVIVGVLGSRFTAFPIGYYCSRAGHLGLLAANSCDQLVHILGTGTVAYHTDTLEVNLSHFPRVNMSDAQLAIRAKRRGVSMVSIKRPKDWLQALVVAGASIFGEFKRTRNDDVKTALIQAEAPWPTLPPIDGSHEQPRISRRRTAPS